MKRLYATLSQVNQTIVRVKSHAELYQSICDVAVQFGEFSAAWIGLLDEASGDVQPTAASGRLDANDWQLPIVNIQAGPLSNGLIAQSFQTSHVMTSDNLQTDERLQSLHEQFRQYGFRSSAVVPFRLRRQNDRRTDPHFSKTRAHSKRKLKSACSMRWAWISPLRSTPWKWMAEHKQAELLLRQSEQKYSIIFDKSPYAIALNKMPENMIVGVNDAFLKLFEFTRTEVIGKTSAELGIADAELRAKIGAEFQAHGKLHDFEVTRTNKAGKRSLNLSVTDLVTIGEENIFSQPSAISPSANVQKILDPAG